MTKSEHKLCVQICFMDIQPIGDNVVITLIEEAETRASGIILPDNAKDRPERGTVLAVGPGKMLDGGQRREMEVKEGDTVLFKKYAPDEFTIGGQKMSVIDVADVIAIIK